MTPEPPEEINWNQIRKEYIQGITQKDQTKKFPTYKELAKQYPVALGTIKNKASEENWGEQKKRYKYRVTKKVQEKKGHDLDGMDPAEVDEAAELDAEQIIQSKSRFEGTGEDLRKAVQKQVDSANTHPERTNPYHLKMLGDALKSALDVVANAQDEIIERNKTEIEGNVKTDVFSDIDKLEDTLTSKNNKKKVSP